MLDSVGRYILDEASILYKLVGPSVLKIPGLPDDISPPNVADTP